VQPVLLLTSRIIANCCKIGADWPVCEHSCRVLYITVVARIDDSVVKALTDAYGGFS